MGHASVDNGTPFAFESFFLMDEGGRPLLVPLLKATFDIVPGKGLKRAEVQAPIDAAGRRVQEADDSSYLNEPECTTFFKPATDVAFIATAFAPHAGAATSNVALGVGKLRKTLVVRGNRSWVQLDTGIRMTAPEAFESIPLVYERALGGWDRSDPERPAYEPRNPAGVGFRAPEAPFVEGPLPNIEDPDDPVTTYGQSPSPSPAGVGFVSPGWEPRIRLAGTFDASWRQERLPLFPTDFDRRFFNAGSPGLVADGYLAGNEEVFVEGASKNGRLSFALPGVRTPSCRVGIRRHPDEDVKLRLDTIVIDTDAMCVSLLWRGHLALPDSAHDVRWVAVR